MTLGLNLLVDPPFFKDASYVLALVKVGVTINEWDASFESPLLPDLLILLIRLLWLLLMWESHMVVTYNALGKPMDGTTKGCLLFSRGLA